LIFVTVGTQLSFDRLVKNVEKWALDSSYSDIVFQVGEKGYQPSVGAVYEFISGHEADEYFNKADVIIGHAGMGTILSCLSEGKPLVIMPRLFSLGEHRNDHQLATFNKFAEQPGLFPAKDETRLCEAIEQALKAQNSEHDFSSLAPEELTDYIREQVILGN